MGPSYRGRVEVAEAVGLLESEGSGGRHVPTSLTMVLSVLTPANLLLGGVLLAGWLVLVGWTGAGPEGWQARLCADLDLQPRSCSAIRITDDAGRGQPVGAGRPQS
jgi:hypothetical protein